MVPGSQRIAYPRPRREARTRSMLAGTPIAPRRLVLLRPPRRAREGVTMIEVVAALGLLALGVAGVMAVQKTVIASGAHARNLAAANAIAMAWAERLRVDGVQWIEPGPGGLAPTRW